VEHSLKRKIDDGPSTSKQMPYVAATAQTVGELCHKLQHSALTYLNF
jgi:hypothetical protein